MNNEIAHSCHGVGCGLQEALQDNRVLRAEVTHLWELISKLKQERNSLQHIVDQRGQLMEAVLNTLSLVLRKQVPALKEEQELEQSIMNELRALLLV